MPRRDENGVIEPAALRARLDAGLAAMGGDGAGLDDAVRARLVDYVRLLAHWNRAFNLTAVRDPAAMVPRHLLDSLAVLPWVIQGPVLDLGTGAGLPGVPLAIARPGLAFTLLDSNGKKTRFVQQAVLELGLTNVEVVQERLETYRPARKFATIVARALASLPQLIAGAQSHAASDGRLLALKGRLSEDELAVLNGCNDHAAPQRSAAGFGGKQRADPPLCHSLTVPGIDGERTLIEVPFGSSTYG